MKRLISASIVSLSLALAGCSGESEDAPDIAEAIPLDPEGSETDEGSEGGDAAQGEAGSGSDTPDLPDANSGERDLPATMESGSNPPGMSEPPAGSKVQRVEG